MEKCENCELETLRLYVVAMEDESEVAVCESCLEGPEDRFQEDDGDALASAGWGTDEDYGYYGGDE